MMRNCMCVYWALGFVLFCFIFCFGFVGVSGMHFKQNQRGHARVSCGWCSDHDHAIKHLLAKFNVKKEYTITLSMEHAAATAAAHCAACHWLLWCVSWFVCLCVCACVMCVSCVASAKAACGKKAVRVSKKKIKHTGGSSTQ